MSDTASTGHRGSKSSSVEEEHHSRGAAADRGGICTFQNQNSGEISLESDDLITLGGPISIREISPARIVVLADVDSKLVGERSVAAFVIVRLRGRSEGVYRDCELMVAKTPPLGVELVIEEQMQKPRKQTRRGVRYRTLARGYKALKSPLAQSLAAAAEYYDKVDRADDPNAGEAEKGAADTRKSDAN